MELPTLNIEDVIAAMLVLIRVSCLLILMPVLGHRLVPAQVKIGLSALLAILLYPAVANSLPQMPATPLALMLVAIQEILIAAMLAMVAQLIFAAAQFAGQVMGYQMGLAIANVFDPTTSAQISIVGQFSIVLSMLIWLSAGAHNAFLFALADSFDLLPIGQPLDVSGFLALNEMASSMFVLALRLVAPMLLLLFFLYVALGLLSRAVPQIQVFFVSFPLTVGIGFLAFALALPSIISLMHDSFTGISESLPVLLRALSGV
ncbi:flagellar biosynthetic protein FliR [Mariprofundus ferrinatatus]|uniref:Flagellar biosynthetic protein FliR n=1 Tax=Mariprofundus ferrinatatus TaxID=1921087 RepID=A0A2K8L729_9PROT|nr:flagellar biosynthetic protein FliR [Mariprofundus ferrinatatus]ATX82932.1 flagellar biosynthetic protein FliR [Mariprofundus ferrinatatus]